RQLAMLLLDLCQGGGDRLVAGHVEHQRATLNAMAFQGFGNALGARDGGGGAHHHGALTTQLEGDGLADATTGARDQGYLTLQTHETFSLIKPGRRGWPQRLRGYPDCRCPRPSRNAC